MARQKYFEYGSWFDLEQKYQNRAEIFLIFTIVLSLVDVILAFVFNQFHLSYADLINQIIVIFVFIFALISAFFEKKSQNYSFIGDFGRRANFYLDLFSEGFKKELEDRLESDFEFNRNSFDNSYSNINLGLKDTVEKFKVKIFRFYEILFKIEKSRKYYKKKLELKYYPIWIILFILIILGLEVGSQTINRLIFYILTILVLSPYTFKTISVIWNWDKKTQFFIETRNRLLNLSNISELHYLFLEYSIELQDIFKVPNRLYSENRDQIESELKIYLKQKEADFNRIGIFFLDEYFNH